MERKPLDDDERLTPEEQLRRMEDLVLKRAADIRLERKARKAALRHRAHGLKKGKHETRLLKRCKDCGAFRFLMLTTKRHDGKVPK